MTTTAAELSSAHDLRDQRVDERRRTLRRIAEIVVSEAGYVKPGQEDFADSVLQMIMPVLAGAGVQFPMVEFEVVCDAIRQFQAFNSDERVWLEGAGLRTDDATREQQYQLLEGAVESSLDRLMGRVH
jgi:hypothetical protein